MSLSEKNLEEVENFSPSSCEEIDSFSPQLDEKFNIIVLDTCPFTNITSCFETIAYVEDILHQDSKYEYSFSYTDSYGLDKFRPFERCKITKRISVPTSP